METEREDRCCFFHLTNNQISFLFVSCEADTSLSSRRDEYTKNAEFLLSLPTGSKTPHGSQVSVTTCYSRDLGQNLWCPCRDCRRIFFACACSAQHSLHRVASALLSMTGCCCEADGVQMEGLSVSCTAARLPCVGAATAAQGGQQGSNCYRMSLDIQACTQNCRA